MVQSLMHYERQFAFFLFPEVTPAPRQDPKGFHHWIIRQSILVNQPIHCDKRIASRAMRYWREQIVLIIKQRWITPGLYANRTTTRPVQPLPIQRNVIFVSGSAVDFAKSTPLFSQDWLHTTIIPSPHFPATHVILIRVHIPPLPLPHPENTLYLRHFSKSLFH